MVFWNNIPWLVGVSAPQPYEAASVQTVPIVRMLNLIVWAPRLLGLSVGSFFEVARKFSSNID